MLESSFDKDINLRPKASLFYDIIRDELKKSRNGNTEGLNDTWIQRCRSDLSLRRLLCEEEMKRFSATSAKMEVPEDNMKLMSGDEENDAPQLVEDSG